MSANPPTPFKRLLSDKRFLTFALGFLIWVVILIRAAEVFTVGSLHVTMFNSDSAIVVLMANENRPATAYNIYYYGQDRFGAWPFLLAQLIHRVTGFYWGHRTLFLVQTLWLFVGALLFSTFNRRPHEDLWVGLLYLLPLCLHIKTRQNMFDLSQPYAWQTTALVLSWWCLRRYCERCFGLLENDGPKNRKRVWGALTFLFSLLAVLSSTVSVPILFFLIVLEVLRAAHNAEGWPRLKSLGRRLLQVAAPVAAAAATELLLRASYHRYSLKHFGTENRTTIVLDWGHLAENFSNQWTRFANSPWWLLSLLPLLAFAGWVVRCTYSNKKSVEKMTGCLRKLFLEDRAVLVAGAYGIGLISFVITVVVSHIRVNDYSERYLAISYLFIAFSGLLTLLLLLGGVKKRRGLVAVAVPVASLLFLFINFPQAATNSQYITFQEATRHLSQNAPGNVILGGYWETYVFAALDPKHVIVPLPAEGQSLRTPWTKEPLQLADQVIVEHHRKEMSRELGGADAPLPQLVQYGETLRLVSPRWYVNGEYVFSIYKREPRQP
jgi:hypothetical protein